MADSKMNETTRELIDSLRETSKVIADSAVAAQERNTRFAQSVFENGIEVLKSQVGLTRGLMQELEQQSHKQQDAFQALARESWDAYLGFMRAPFSYYQRACDTAQRTM